MKRVLIYFLSIATPLLCANSCFVPDVFEEDRAEQVITFQVQETINNITTSRGAYSESIEINIDEFELDQVEDFVNNISINSIAVNVNNGSGAQGVRLEATYASGDESIRLIEDSDQLFSDFAGDELVSINNRLNPDGTRALVNTLKNIANGEQFDESIILEVNLVALDDQGNPDANLTFDLNAVTIELKGDIVVDISQ